MASKALSPVEWGAIALVVLIWGVNNAAAKVLTETLDPVLVGGIRFAIGTACLLPFLRPPFPPARQLFWLVLCGGPLHFALVYWGFQLADNLSAYAVVLQMWIPFVALLAWVLLGERLGRAELAGMAVAFAGVAFMALDGGAVGDWQSVLVGTAASVFWAAAVVLARRTVALPPLKMQGIISVFAAPVMLAGGLWRQPDGLRVVAESPPLIWAALLWAGVVSTVIATGLVFWLVQGREAGRVTPYFLVTPLVSGWIGVAFLGDVLTPAIWIGGTATLAGVGVVALAERRRAVAALNDPA